MPSPNEIKQIMEEKVIPFFEDGKPDELEMSLVKTQDIVKQLENDVNTLAARVDNLERGVSKRGTVKIDESGRASVEPKGKK